MPITPPMPEEVSAAISGFPAPARARLQQLRTLIFDAADRCGAGPLTETLKWGEPAYLTEATGSGTTVRLGWKPADREVCKLMVNCRTDLLSQYRDRFPDELDYEGNRAIRLPIDAALPAWPLGICIGLALTYHRDKSGMARRADG